MTFKILGQTVLLGCVLAICLLLGSEPSLGMAKASTAFQVDTTTEQQSSLQAPDLKMGVDHFLADIPTDYYAVSSVKDLKTLLNTRRVVLIDVREGSEYEADHIPSAINIPLRTLAAHVDRIPHDRPVVLYCSSGYRSAMGVMTLHLLGYENAQGFPPSFAGWLAARETISSGVAAD